MTEVLNQEPQTENSDENLFAGFEPVQETEEPVQETEQPVEDKPFLTIKYNKEEKGLSQEEAVDYAQKGMNYDKILGKYNDLNTPIERLAKLNGMDVPTFINSLNETQSKFEVSKELDALKEKYPETDEEILKELAESRYKQKSSQRELDSRNLEKEQADARQEETRRQMDNFIREYPELKDDLLNDRLDKSIYGYMNEGLTLLEAYSKWERGERQKQKAIEETQAKVAKQNEENKKRSLGNLTNAEVGEGDDFFKGFMNG